MSRGPWIRLHRSAAVMHSTPTLWSTPRAHARSPPPSGPAITRCNLRLRLAVLSACQTGLPGVRAPEEVTNLPTSLVVAGAAGVVGSWWKVLDERTAMLMVAFYERWGGPSTPGPTPDAALR